MKIAWISFAFSDYCIAQAKALAAEHDVLLAIPDVDFPAGEVRFGPKLEVFAFRAPRLRQAIRQIRMLVRIVRKVRDFDPDVIHFQHGHLWFNLVLPLLRRFPLVLTIHDPRHHMGDAESKRTPQAVMDFGFRRADRIIVHGESIAREVRSELGIPGDRIDIVPHVAIGDAEAHPHADENANSVLFFGRIWGYKGLEYLIKAEPLISEIFEDVEITIAGKGENFDRYHQLMQHPEKFRVFNSYISKEERARLFQRAAVVVLPYVSATQSGVVPVAYAFGKPVVVTSVGALPEYVEHGKTGLLVPPRDERALADAIVRLLQDPQMRRTMGEHGRRLLQENWAPDVVARKTVEVYRKAICGPRSGRGRLVEGAAEE